MLIWINASFAVHILYILCKKEDSHDLQKWEVVSFHFLVPKPTRNSKMQGQCRIGLFIYISAHEVAKRYYVVAVSVGDF